jgi:hypothetical protein
VALAGRLARWRWIAVPLVAAATGANRVVGAPADMISFAELGRAVVGGHLAAAYATDTNQAGPLQMLAAAPYPDHLLRSMLLLRMTVAVWGAALGVAAMWLTRVMRRSFKLPSSALLELTAGVVTAFWLVGGDLFSGHLSELMVPVSWVAAGIAVRRGNPLVAGILLGTSAGWESWGVLGIPIVVLAPRLRDAVLAVVSCVVAASALYVPFVLTGSFALLHHRWPILQGTVDHTLWPHATTFGWDLRVLQAGVCTAIGTGVALAVRRRAAAVWLVPLVIILVRLIFDPTDFLYYWSAAQVAVLAGIALVDVNRRLSLTLFAAMFWCVNTAWGPWRTADTVMALMLAIWLAAVERRTVPSSPKRSTTDADPAGDHQPRVASRWSTGTSATLMPTIASPSPRDTFASTSGSS